MMFINTTLTVILTYLYKVEATKGGFYEEEYHTISNRLAYLRGQKNKAIVITNAYKEELRNIQESVFNINDTVEQNDVIDEIRSFVNGKLWEVYEICYKKEMNNCFYNLYFMICELHFYVHHNADKYDINRIIDDIEMRLADLIAKYNSMIPDIQKKIYKSTRTNDLTTAYEVYKAKRFITVKNQILSLSKYIKGMCSYYMTYSLYKTKNEYLEDISKQLGILDKNKESPVVKRMSSYS